MRTFVFDINTAQQCNLRCNYCAIDFDNPKILNFSRDSELKLTTKIQYLLQSPKFYEKFSNIQISFFGGEPSLNSGTLERICLQFEDNPKVKFFMYSNGVKYNDKIWGLLEAFKNTFVGNEPKFLTQISYDGLASHDVDRVDKRGKGSALAVKETIFELRKRGIPFTIHPTIASRNFDKIADNYFEFKRMSNVLEMDLQYSPTIDYLTHFKFTKAEIQKLKETLKLEFLKITKSCVDYYKRYGVFDFGWFNPSKAICSAGDGYYGIEIDGTVKPCHGCFGPKDERYNIASLDDCFQDFESKLLESTEKFHDVLTSELPEKCKNCNTHYCLKCNAAKAENSKSKELLKGWVDYPNQPGLCELYKFIGLYRAALLESL